MASRAVGSMHVLIIPSWFDPNDPYRISPFIFEQALALRSSDMDVGILFVGFSDWGFSYTRRHVDGIRIISVTLPRFLRRMRQLSLAISYGIHEILYRSYSHHYGEPMLLHAHSMYSGGICAAQLSQRHKRPFVVTEHFSGFALGALKKWQLKAIRHAANSTSRMFFVSETLREDFAKQLPVVNGSILPNNYSDKLRGNMLPFRPVNGRNYFCIVGRLDRNKNVELCLRAFAVLRAKSHDLVVVGSGVERTELEQIARELKVAERVIFLGVQTRVDTFAIMKSAAAVVISSAYETFGMTVLEAAILGTPIISTRCGGPVEILGEDFGMLVEKNDIQGLADAMQNVLIDKKIFRCEVAASIVSSLYSPDQISARLKAEYRLVISENE
jgi:glycosyltransferase involved in cell wall biosynthesis